jgi:hypothetical protein
MGPLTPGPHTKVGLKTDQLDVQSYQSSPEPLCESRIAEI